jgi:hypothetical protein
LFTEVNDVALWAGAKAAYDGNFGEFKIGGTLQYVQSSEDEGEDGSFLQVEARGSFVGVNAFFGLFKTDKDGGIGHIKAAGENVNPFEKGCQIFLRDAQTLYLGANYKWNKFEFSGIFGNTDYSDGRIREIDLTVSYNFTENLNVFGTLVNGGGDDNDFDAPSISDFEDDTNTIIIGAVYSF